MRNLPKLKITEFSPEWDYTAGGSKLVLCFLPGAELSERLRERVKVHFGENSVRAYCI
jgi:hypothetical protein